MKKGTLYWYIQLRGKHESNVWLHADRVEVAHGVAIFWSKLSDGKECVVFAASEWAFFHAASVVDGGAPAVEHWDQSNLVRMEDTAGVHGVKEKP